MTTSSISHEIKYKNNLAKNMPDNDKGEKDNSNSTKKINIIPLHKAIN